ncbi:CRISPR-associated endonuclease Cas3'' [Paenibacillus doosanensis]|uniref:DEAD/DEAH box helicase n=1 Tax=Paenibacillus konkukensis TaxID=2020716 RepID=A0ABY4RTT9_9BACL|nr:MULTISPECIES: CRISPR-associated endonuclease Cas3'' [Paenibacillus]MCS7464513.1 CRISPR-associated endonuclease Cas3'' [Paenibacillus doosanensis]UQZ85445.1 DEAD/DEAH box helicase [Paenibacillus konkukensis]
MNKEFIAHVVKNDDGSWSHPHLLSQHAEETARLAESFSSKFRSGEWGKVLGLAHDAGKGRVLWQEYLKAKSRYDEDAHLEGKIGKIPHAIHGAELVEQLFGKGIGRILAYCIAGHHAGLPDWSSAEGAGLASLQFQKNQVNDLDQIDGSIIDRLREVNPLHPPWKFASGLDLSLWIRMLFSSLIDADFLDTERYMDRMRASTRGGYCSISELLERLNQYCNELDVRSEHTQVNKIRKQIRATCRQRAIDEQGMFSLTVPTGGGKTISSLAFALEHAKFHGLDRIIYVIPYSSIIEQNADVFRSALGADQIVEHHSNVDDTDSTVKSRLAAENWDAPLIVTTSVQFFESLFAAKPSRCRKLHNIARSVVVLDEAQLVPAEFLAPILETMRLLVDHYDVSFVISTATQPAFKERTINGKLFKGLKEIKEIMGKEGDIQLLFNELTRNRILVPSDLHTASSWEEIAGELVRYDQVLCIVSDRKSCRELHRLMPEGTYHLSALMCGQHRSDIISEVKQKLKDHMPVRVISTQLVEAGVDLDFPVVYRAMAGLDSIAQAAGRCNREGKLSQLGKVVVFNPPREAPEGILRKAAETTRSILMSNAHDISNADFETFFEEMYWKVHSLDKAGVIALLDPIQNDPRECSIFFRTAANKFKLIDDEEQKTIWVRYHQSNRLIDELKVKGPDRRLLRKLQRYTVSIYKRDFNILKEKKVIEEVYPQMFALLPKRAYSKHIGLRIEDATDTTS